MLIVSAGTCTHPGVGSVTLVFTLFFQEYSCSCLILIQNTGVSL